MKEQDGWMDYGGEDGDIRNREALCDVGNTEPLYNAY